MNICFLLRDYHILAYNDSSYLLNFIRMCIHLQKIKALDDIKLQCQTLKCFKKCNLLRLLP